MEMGGSSDAPTHDLKFMLTSNVHVSNFVSVKLSGTSNYKIWKEQMLCLLKSQALLYIVDAGCPSPGDKGVNPQYDQLVKGWIFGSMNENVLRDLIDSSTAQEVWMKLESLFSPTVSYTEGDSSNAPDVSTLDAIAPVVSAMREDLKYLQALNVDVSNFVSEKLQGKSNHYTWKNEMLCLIRSHELLHIIHAEDARLPWDEGVDPMTQKYDSLVRGWILNTMNHNQRDEYRIYRSVQLMWKKLESTFTYQPETSDSDTEDTEGILECNADDSSNETEDLKYKQLKSNVNVYDFVSVKLSGRSNYNIWKDQMLRLLQSHSLLHIIGEEAPSQQDKDDPMTKKYDSLVRGWLLSTMNDEEHRKYRIYRSVKLMWSRVKLNFDETEDLKYMEASNVNVSDFVSVNLSDANNYSIWKAQMLYFLECHSLLHIINEYCLEEDKYPKLVKGWILCTMNDELLKDFPADDYVGYTTKGLWKKLESRFTKGYPSHEPVLSASSQDQKYTQALNVNVSNFVSVKLSGRNNYEIWKGQMLCLIESQKLFHIIDKEGGYEVGKYNTLVKGWIFSTMNEQLLSDLTSADNLVDCAMAKDVWEKLTSAFDRQDPQEVEFGVEFIKDGIESESDLPESDNTDKKRWYKAVAAGCLRKAKSIFKIQKNIATEVTTTNDDPILHVAVETESSGTEVVRDTPDVETGNSRTDIKKELYDAAAKGRWRKAKSILRNSAIAATEAITANGDTILHVAVERSQNYFVEELLRFLKNEEDMEKKNEKGRTALHIAAVVDNMQAAQLLVLKREELLVIEDEDKNLPLHLASQYTNLDMYAYLLEQSFRPPNSDNRIDYRTYWSHKATILAAIFSKQYDLVETLLKVPMIMLKYDDHDYNEILMAITISYPTDIAFQNVRQKTIVRGSLLFQPYRCVDDILRVVEICNNMWHNTLRKNSNMLLVMITLYLICQLIYLFLLILRLPFSMLYFLLWKILAFIVSPIKNIEKKKKEYKDAKKILSLVCNQMHKSNKFHNDTLFEAVRLDNHEVVDEILFTSHATINCKDEEGYNIIQSSILNRSEKVYNLIYHIIERTKSHKEMTDNFSNNLCHLSGRLAPSFVLDRTTGAALQLQREILWFEEVQKLVLPLQLTQKNIFKETPVMVFTREHRDLQKQGETWMKTTTESCSITAALIVTIGFAAAITIPGGNNQQSGIPLFKTEIAFTIFAVSNALSLFTACTALLLFLLTRFSVEDFLVSLPRRLILGLFNLLLSTISMLVAFCAILFLVFCDQRPWMLAPISAFACLPISVIATIKLSLLVDLIQSTYSPIFGKQSYLESCKVNRKNTIFTK